MLGKKFKIPGGLEKCLSELSAKEMYHIFMLSSELQLKPIQYWMSKYPDENIDFDKWFKLIHMGKLGQRKFTWLQLENISRSHQYLDKTWENATLRQSLTIV